jgi:hypothetical protein
MNGRVRVLLDQAIMVVQRLERLSADSAWAHISSGYRGALVKIIDQFEQRSELEDAPEETVDRLEFLIDKGFDLLSNAAREIGDPELILGLVSRSRESS